MLMGGVGAQVAVAVVVRVGPRGLQEQAEETRLLLVWQPIGMAELGKPVVIVLIVVV